MITNTLKTVARNFYTVQQISEKLRVSSDIVYRTIKVLRLHPSRLGNQYLLGWNEANRIIRHIRSRNRAKKK